MRTLRDVNDLLTSCQHQPESTPEATANCWTKQTQDNNQFDVRVSNAIKWSRENSLSQCHFNTERKADSILQKGENESKLNLGQTYVVSSWWCPKIRSVSCVSMFQSLQSKKFKYVMKTSYLFWTLGLLRKKHLRLFNHFGQRESICELTRIYIFTAILGIYLERVACYCTALPYPGQPFSFMCLACSAIWPCSIRKSRRCAHSASPTDLHIHFSILCCLSCWLDSLRLKFTNEPSIFVDGNLAESRKHSPSNRLGESVPYGWAQNSPFPLSSWQWASRHMSRTWMF